MVAERRMATLEDLDRTPDDGQRYEIIDGEIVVSAAPTWKHQATIRRLDWIISDWVRETQEGEIQLAPLDIVLSGTLVLQPDLTFIRYDNLGGIERGRFHGVPDVCVEVISPTSRSRDNVVKPIRYQDAGVPEFWLVDPETRSLAVYALIDGRYEVREPDLDGQVTSAIMDGVQIDPVTLFDQVEASVRRFTRD